MRPSVDQQLHGIARILEDLVKPSVGAAYPADVLAGVIETLRLLADSLDDIEPFLEWDADAASAILRVIGIDPSIGEDESPAARQRRVRQLLEESMDLVADHPVAHGDVLAMFRERSERFPLAPGGRRVDRPR